MRWVHIGIGVLGIAAVPLPRLDRKTTSGAPAPAGSTANVHQCERQRASPGIWIADTEVDGARQAC